MLEMERRIRPASRPRPWGHDVLCAGLVLLLAAVLVPAYGPGWGWVLHSGDQSAADQLEYVTDVAGQMASSYLPMALGFALVLRQGGIDLSVWSVAGLGGVTAAMLMAAGVPAWLAFVAAAASGALVGALNRMLVLRLKAPTVAATLATGLAVMGILHLWPGGQAVKVDQQAFAGWIGWLDSAGRQAGSDGPARWGPVLMLARMALVLVAYAAVVLGAMSSRQADDPAPRAHRRSLGTALVLAGGLAGLSGAVWLMDRSQAPLPIRPVGDLRIVAAAVLAGAAALAGRGRTVVVGLLLPGALLVATAWRQEVLDLSWGGYNLQVVLLIGMAIVTHQAFAALTASRTAPAPPTPGRRRRFAGLSALLCGAGMLLGAQSGTLGATPAAGAFLLAGLLTWAAGAVLLALAR